MNIKHKLWVLIGFFIFGFLFLGIAQILYGTNYIISEKIEDSKRLVSVMDNVLTNSTRHYLEIINGLKLDKNQYVFILDNDGVMLVHPNKELVGKSALGLKDSSGFPVIQKIMDIANTGEGLISYYFQKPNDSSEYYKTSYVMKNIKHNWVIGSGFYYSDIYAELIRNIIWFLIIFLFIISIVLFFSIRITNNINSSIENVFSIISPENVPTTDTLSTQAILERLVEELEEYKQADKEHKQRYEMFQHMLDQKLD